MISNHSNVNINIKLSNLLYPVVSVQAGMEVARHFMLELVTSDVTVETTDQVVWGRAIVSFFPCYTVVEIYLLTVVTVRVMNKALPSLFCASNPDSTMSITWLITCSSCSGSSSLMLMAEETRRRMRRLNLSILMGGNNQSACCQVSGKLRSASYIPRLGQ